MPSVRLFASTAGLLFSSGPLNKRGFRLLAGSYECGCRSSRCTKRFHILIKSAEICVVHRPDVKPGHWRPRRQTLRVLEPFVFRHFAEGKPEVGRIGRTPRPAISE